MSISERTKEWKHARRMEHIYAMGIVKIFVIGSIVIMVVATYLHFIGII